MNGRSERLKGCQGDASSAAFAKTSRSGTSGHMPMGSKGPEPCVTSRRILEGLLSNQLCIQSNRDHRM